MASGQLSTVSKNRKLADVLLAFRHLVRALLQRDEADRRPARLVDRNVRLHREVVVLPPVVGVAHHGDALELVVGGAESQHRPDSFPAPGHPTGSGTGFFDRHGCSR